MRVLLFFFLFQVCLSYKFLIYSPLFGHSHSNFLGRIADTLTEAGHNVTFLVPIMDHELLEKKNVYLTKDVIMIESNPDIFERMKATHEFGFRQMWERSVDMIGLMDLVKNMSISFADTCTHLFQQKTLLEELKNRKYDVGIAEPFHLCGLGAFKYLEIPATIGVISAIQLEVLSYHIGEPIAISYVPSTGSTADGANMTLFQRFWNAFETIVGFKIMSNTFDLEEEILVKQFGENYEGYSNLLSQLSFVFVNSNPYLNYPRPLLHKTIEIGGITIDVKNPGNFGKNWDKVLNEQRHSVFISFGSVAKSKDMPHEYKDSFLKLCASLPNVTFIWKYEEETTMADHLPNLHLSPWLPQNALLADPRLTIFITHGGIGSINEVASFGKPSIIIPLFADQSRNGKMLARHGGAIALEKLDLGRPDVVRKAIETILNNKSYAKSAEKLAKLLTEPPITPKDLVVKHSEFVAKFGTLKNLEPYGRNLSLVQYYLIDVICVVLLVLVLVLLLIYVAIRVLFIKLCSSQKLKRD